MNTTTLTPPPTTGWRMPFDASLYGWKINDLIDVTLILVTILFVIMVIWMAIAMIKHGRNNQAHYSHGEESGWLRAKLLIASLIFLGVDGNLFINSTRDLHDTFWNFKAVDADPKTVKIEVNAHQWAWEARYAGLDGKFNTADDIVTTNDIRVPVDRPVYLQMAASDVLHSFYLPNFRIKQDVVPGNVTFTWFHPKNTGLYEIACAQHCGVHHYKMRGELRVMPQEDFDRWSNEAQVLSQRDYDETHQASHWGWNWREAP